MGKSEIFDEMQRQMIEIDEELSKDPSEGDHKLRMILRASRLHFAAFIQISGEDHRRMNVVWPAFQVLAWAAAVVGATILANSVGLIRVP